MTKSSPSAVDNERIIIGKVGKPHGVKGCLNVYPLTDFPDRFDNLREVTVGEELVPIKALSWNGNSLLITFGGYETREKAASLTGKLLSVPQTARMPLEAGEYYVTDIIGLNAYDEMGNILGEVADVIRTGANDVYVIRRQGNKDLLLPALKQFILSINVEKNKMLVRPLPEL